MIEVEVHNSLRTFLRSSGEPYWPHHLTMARLVARALRLGRGALIQTGIFPGGSYGRYRLSYLMPVLMWPEPAILVAPEAVRQRLLMVEIPQLQQWVQTAKPIRTGSAWPYADFPGVLITSPEDWLADRLQEGGSFPPGIATIFDGVDDLEVWAQNQLTACLEPADWHELMLACPEQAEEIRDARVQLTREVYRHPANPYECCLVEGAAAEILNYLFERLHRVKAVASPPESVQELGCLPPKWRKFWQQNQAGDHLVWAQIARRQGLFSLYCGPVEVANQLSKLWSAQPVVLIGGALDLETQALAYRQRVGLPEVTCLKFSPDRQNQEIQLYLPDGLPLPNTPQYQEALLEQVRRMLAAVASVGGLTVLLVGDMPLKGIVGAKMAAEFGSRVQVEKTCLEESGILVTGWEFWRQNQNVLPAPRLLVIATLPIPSLENPLVAGRVAHYKQQRQDWFRLYLLPVALSLLQRAIAPVRNRQGMVALLDSRVLHRSYGKQVLAALSPLARIDYVDESLFTGE